MSTNEKEFLLWLLVVMILGFVLRHLLAVVLFALGKAVVMNLFVAPGASHFAAAFFPFC